MATPGYTSSIASPSLDWLVKDNGNILGTEAMGETQGYHGSWSISIFNVQVVYYHILWEGK